MRTKQHRIGRSQKVQRTISFPEKIDAQLVEAYRELRQEGDIEHFSAFLTRIGKEWLESNGPRLTTGISG